MLKKIEQKKKDIILKAKINNFYLDMQMDTGSEVTLIPKKKKKKQKNSWNGLESQLYERAGYNSANLMGRS